MGPFPDIVADQNAFWQIRLQQAYVFRVRDDSPEKASSTSSNSSVTVDKFSEQKFYRFQRLRNESSRVRSAAEQAPDHAWPTVRDLCNNSCTKDVLQRSCWNTVTAQYPYSIEQASRRRQQVVDVISRRESAVDSDAENCEASDLLNVLAWWWLVMHEQTFHDFHQQRV